MRTVLETWMVVEELLTQEDVETLLHVPVARYFLPKLILVDAQGVSGLVEPETGQLRDLQGQRRAPVYPLLVAHPYHLEAADVLGAWQRALVKQRVVQPFRQAFRELYLLTPAEKETVTYSNRFAGHQVDAARAYRLFQSRQWRVSHAEYASPARIFARQGLCAMFAFRDVGHFFSENETVTSGAISFVNRAGVGDYAPRQEQTSLADVPPVLFSEVMRDADLVVSVAQWTEEAAARRAWQRAEAEAALRRRSEEAFRRQAELVQILLQDLNLRGVEIEGHYALVQGELASYRVHLGSGSVFVEPGSYLCIVPDYSASAPEGLFLPFDDNGSQRASVVISKIVLLLNDARIKDATILEQIQRATSGPR